MVNSLLSLVANLKPKTDEYVSHFQLASHLTPTSSVAIHITGDLLSDRQPVLKFLQVSQLRKLTKGTSAISKVEKGKLTGPQDVFHEDCQLQPHEH